MNLTKNFTLEELIKSSTALRKGIDNSPSEEIKSNLTKLTTDILQPVRDAWGAPIIIGSGYRCRKLNTAVGGAKNSDHMYGCAADIRTVSDTFADNKKLYDCIMQLVKAGKLHARQIIWEYGTSVGPDWVHISINSSHNSYKDNQTFKLGTK